MVMGLCAEQLRRERLGRYFSPSVAQEIERDNDGLTIAQNTEVTVLFADLRNFTTLAEQMDVRLSPEIFSRFHAERGILIKL